MDCSALVSKLYPTCSGSACRAVPPNEASHLEMPTNVAPMNSRPGFGLLRSKPRTGQSLGIYLAGGHFLHAARSEGVTISKLDGDYWKSRFMFSKRFRGLETVRNLKTLWISRKSSRTIRPPPCVSDFGAGGMLSTLEAGVRVNDSLELALSGFLRKRPLGQRPVRGQFNGVYLRRSPDSNESEGGFRLAAILSPWEWFKVKPSVTQIDSAGDRLGRKHDQRQKIGLESWMVLPSTRWPFFWGPMPTTRKPAPEPHGGVTGLADPQLRPGPALHILRLAALIPVGHARLHPGRETGGGPCPAQQRADGRRGDPVGRQVLIPSQSILA